MANIVIQIQPETTANWIHRVSHEKHVDKSTGIVIVEQYLDKDRRLHNVNAPARILRDPETGILISEAYYQHGKRHRIGGPAFTRYNYGSTNGLYAEYWRDGKKDLTSYRPGTIAPTSSAPEPTARSGILGQNRHVPFGYSF